MFFVGPNSDHWLPLSLTNSVTAVLVNLIDVTLASEDTSSILAEVTIVAEVDVEIENVLTKVW